MGAGRLLDQDLSRINNAIQNGTFDQNTVLANSLRDLTYRKKKLHIMRLDMQLWVWLYLNVILYTKLQLFRVEAL